MKTFKKPTLAQVAKKIANMTTAAKAKYINFLYSQFATEVDIANEAAAL